MDPIDATCNSSPKSNKRPFEVVKSDEGGLIVSAAAPTGQENEPSKKRVRWLLQDPQISNSYGLLEKSGHINALPSDVLIVIFEHFTFATLRCVIRLVCRSWNDCCSNSTLYSDWDISYVTSPVRSVVSITNGEEEGWISNLSIRKQFQFPLNTNTRTNKMKKFSRMKHTSFSKLSAPDDLMACFVFSQPYLFDITERLTLRGCSGTGVKAVLKNGDLLVQRTIPSLTYIHLENCRLVTNNEMKYLIFAVPNLRSLRIGSCPLLSGMIVL
jgi:hypothetical protein